MIFTLLQVVAFVAITACFWRCRASMRRRNAQSWESLMSRLRPDGCARELTEFCFSCQELSSTPLERWRRLRNVHVLSATYANAGVMLEIADYAAYHGASVSNELLATLRSEALQVRLCVLKTLASYAFCAAKDTLWTNALRTEAAYAEMALRITELLETDAAEMVPSFVAAL